MLQSSPRPNRVDSRYHERAVLYCAIIDVCNYVEIYACLRRHDHTLAPFHSPSLSTRKRICNTHEETRLISLSLSLSLSVFSLRYVRILRPRFFFFPPFQPRRERSWNSDFSDREHSPWLFCNFARRTASARDNFL